VYRCRRKGRGTRALHPILVCRREHPQFTTYHLPDYTATVLYLPYLTCCTTPRPPCLATLCSRLESTWSIPTTNDPRPASLLLRQLSSPPLGLPSFLPSTRPRRALFSAHSSPLTSLPVLTDTKDARFTLLPGAQSLVLHSAFLAVLQLSWDGSLSTVLMSLPSVTTTPSLPSFLLSLAVRGRG
jgi:hypothetical protein